MSKQLKSLSLVALFAAMFMFQSPTPANAGWGWLCWWCGPPSAEEMIEERPNLRRQSSTVKEYFAKAIRKYRSINGATEDSLEIFLDKLDEEYQRQSSIFRNWFISPAMAGPEVICLPPNTGTCIGVLARIASAAKKAKKAAVAGKAALTTFSAWIVSQMSSDTKTGYKSVEDITDDGGTEYEGKTRKGTKKYTRPGGMEQADKDFDDLEGEEKETGEEGVRVKELPDGDRVIVRPNSTDDNRPTLEVQTPGPRGKYGPYKPKIKILYN